VNELGIPHPCDGGNSIITSCEKKIKEVVTVSYNYLNVAEVKIKIGNIYNFPLSLNDGKGEMPFTLKESPEGSSLITFDNKKYLEWEPKKQGTYRITISNADESFQQSYEIVVKN
jgi:hypothetical protein